MTLREEPTHPTIVWSGARGAQYTYYIWKLPASIQSGSHGNYIYTRIGSDNIWAPLYIGQGDLGVHISENHRQISCINSKGAAYVHVHLNPNKQSRLSEARDILASYSQSYKPVGCNEKLIVTDQGESSVRQLHDMAPDRYKQCGICYGTGKIDCSSCNGMGGRSESRVDYDWENNPIYQDEWVPCYSCNGGYSTCYGCDGSGSVAK
jgi:hypothetical protein